MEDQAQFKVYTFWAEDSKPEVRRFGVDKSVVTSFHYLTAKLLDLLPGLRNKTYTVTWKDEDGDDVSISSDEELFVALSNMTGIIKIHVHVKHEDSKQPASDDEACEFFASAFHDATAAAAQAGVSMAGIPHAGVVCDSCDGPVVGFRYKCATCPDYDLCSRCEASGMHSDHCMVRVPMPLMPRHLIKAAIKRSRHFLKTVAVGEECPYKKHKREKSGDRKHHRRDHHGEHRDRRERRPRTSWLETFATYMNEFANLAGDTDCHPPTDAPKASTQNVPEQTQETPTAQANAETPGPNTQAQPTGEKTQANGGGATKEAKHEITFDKLLNPDNVKYLLDLQKTLTDILIPNLVQVPGTSTPPPTPANEVNVDMEQGDRKVVEEKEKSPDVSVKSEASSSSDKDDKADGWTVINKENDLMDVAGKPFPSAPEPMVPIGFDLPEEFQKRVNINSEKIYPPLHTATAVLDPTPAREPPTPLQPQPAPVQPQPTSSQPQAVPTQPQAVPTQPQAVPTQPQATPSQPQAAAQPQPQPRPRHPKAHIEAAIQHMLAMGFNNDSGWITQLLETKDGNISAVLDLLTPVAMQKK